MKKKEINLIDYIKFRRIYLRQYQILEDEVIQTFDYVDFDNLNFKTFSIKFEHIIVKTCMQIESIAMLYINKKVSVPDKISEISSLYLPDLSSICLYLSNNYSNTLINLDLYIKPFFCMNVPKENPCIDKNDNKSQNNTEELGKYWWTVYNKLKHEKLKYFKFANLENTLHALGALYILVMHYNYYYKENDIYKSLHSNLFESEKDFIKNSEKDPFEDLDLVATFERALRGE